MEPLGPWNPSGIARPDSRSTPAQPVGKCASSPSGFPGYVLLAALLASSCSHAPLAGGPPPRFLPPKEVAILPAAVLRVSFSPDGGRIALCGEDNAVRIYRVDTWQAERSLETASPPVRDIGWDRGGNRIAAVSGDGFHVFEAGSGKELLFVRAFPGRGENSPEGSGAEPAEFAWSPSGNRIALAGFDNAVVRVYSGAALDETVSLKGHSRAVTAVEWVSEEQLFTASWDGTVRRWDAGSGKGGFLTPNIGEGRIRLGLLDGISALATMSYGDMALLVWDLRTGTLRKKVHSVAPLALFRSSPDSRLAALADTYGFVRIREIPGWDVIREFGAGGFVAGGFVEEMQWSMGGRHLAAKVAGDPAITVWDVATGGGVRLWVREDDQIAMDWSPDGRRLVTGGRSGKVREWDFATPPGGR